MRNLLVAAILSTCTGQAWAANTKFVEFITDQSNYEVGAKAVIFAKTNFPPTNPRNQLHLRLTLDGEEIYFVRLSDRLAVAFPPRFTSPGVVEAQGEVYFEDASTAQQLEQSIAFYQKENQTLQAKLAGEVDPEARALIEQSIARNLGLIQQLTGTLNDQRTLVEIGFVSIAVGNSLTGPNLSGVFNLFADRDPAEYSVGEKATFSTQVLTDFTGPDGPREIVFRASIEDVSVTARDLGGRNYSFTSASFIADQVGPQVFTAALWIRSKKQADLLRAGVKQATNLKADYVRQQQGSLSPSEQAYAQLKIDELTAAIAAMNTQLESSLLHVSTRNFNFTVLN